MPTYDFTCQDCHKRFDVFMSFKDYGVLPVTCSHCGSGNVRRRVNRVRLLRSEDSRMDSLTGDFSDPSALEGLENDPQAMARMFKKMGNELGEEMPPQFDEIVDRLEAGQSPEEIEKSIPDLAEPPGGGDDGHDHADDE
jgi:putative FmdB family regulatory protein